jgi:tetratricopeptide (TPR) repeat protein
LKLLTAAMRSLILIAVMLIQIKKYDQQCRFTKDIEILPNATRSYINRGFVYIQQNKYDLAIADFTKSIEINPKEGYAYFNRGSIYDRQGKKDLSIADYTKAIEIDSNNTIIYSARGNIYTLQKIMVSNSYQ